MLASDINALGKKKLVQSIRTWKDQSYIEDAVILGLDTEFYEENGKHTLTTWQLGWSATNGKIFTSPLTAKAIVEQVKLIGGVDSLGSVAVKKAYIATFFVTAEAQFFLSDEWQVSEYKGKYSFHTEVDGMELYVLDVASWFQHQPLKAAAEVFGLKKLDYDIVEKMKGYKATKKLDGKKKADYLLLQDDEFVKYAINDACVVCAMLQEMRHLIWRDYAIDILHQRTAAATAAAVFRKHYVVHDIQNRQWSLRNQALRSSWGGRSECFFRGKQPDCFQYDAHAHHPSSAIQLDVLPEEKDWRRTTELNDFLSSRGGVCRVSFEFPINTDYPCLPVVSEKSLIFPLSGVSDCTGAEVKLAVWEGASVVIQRGWVYDNGTHIATDYFLDVDARRKEAKTVAESVMYKLLMNSIVGKFFQKNRTVDIERVRVIAREKGIPESVAMSLLQGQVHFSSVGQLFYPEWYVLILGYARASISALAAKEKALMVSSDSVVVDHRLKEEVYDGIAYRLERQGMYIGYRSKLYRVGKKIAHHAVHDRQVAGEILADMLLQDEFSYQTQHIVKLRESYRRSIVFGSDIVSKQTVSLNYDYKRRLNDDGTTTAWRDADERAAYMSSLREAKKEKQKNMR